MVSDERGAAHVHRRFKGYQNYKASGHAWLPEIPAAWSVRRLKTLIAEPITDGPHETPEFVSDGVPFLSVDGIQNGELVFEGCRRISKAAHSEYQRKCSPRLGDILLGKAASTGKIARVKVDFSFGIWSPLALIRPNRQRVFPNFLEYALKSATTQAQIDVLCTSNTQKNISMRDIPTLTVIVPSLREQLSIAAFLDRETAKIDVLVAKKQKLIDLLEEQRAALITAGVTKSLDATVPPKESGAEWMGKIPANWEVRPLKAVSELQTGLTLGKAYEGRSLVSRPYLRVANVQDGFLDLGEITELDLPEEIVSRYELQAGDVLMTEGGDFDKLGRGYVWEAQIPGCLHQNHIFAVRPKSLDLDSNYLALVMSSGYGRAYFTATSKQATNLASTNSTKLRNMPIPLPSLVEQRQIAARLNFATVRSNGLINRVGTAVQALNELRTALISAAVTGKIDVRSDRV